MLELVKYVMLKNMAKPKQRPFRPSDPLALAKTIGDIATGQTDPLPEPTLDEVRRVMSMLGKIGGKKGGPARADALSKTRRREIARGAAQARWKLKK